MVKWLNISIWSINGIVTCTTIPSLSGTACNNNEGVITFCKTPGLEPQHLIVLGHTLDTRWEGSYPSAEIQSAYSAALTNRVTMQSSSSSFCRAISADIPGPLSPPLPLVHRIRQVLRIAPRILKEVLYVRSNWSPCFWSAMWTGP